MLNAIPSLLAFKSGFKKNSKAITGNIWGYITPNNAGTSYAPKLNAKTIIEAGNKAFETAKPGITCEEVESVWQKELNKNGYEKKSRVGYSIGLNFPPDCGERTASLRAGDKTFLEEGMCFHFQSGVWLENFGAAISESIIITKNGAEKLCNVERKLF